MPKRIFRKFIAEAKRHHRKLMQERKTPHAIAFGFAIGTFISILPTPGFNLILGLLVSFFFPRASKLAIIASIFFWNPVTTFPVYALSYKIGGLIFQRVPHVQYDVTFLNTVYNYSKKFIVGNIILAFAIAPISYLIVKKIAESYQNKALFRQVSGHHKK